VLPTRVSVFTDTLLGEYRIQSHIKLHGGGPELAHCPPLIGDRTTSLVWWCQLRIAPTCFIDLYWPWPLCRFYRSWPPICFYWPWLLISFYWPWPLSSCSLDSIGKEIPLTPYHSCETYRLCLNRAVSLKRCYINIWLNEFAVLIFNVMRLCLFRDVLHTFIFAACIPLYT